jgi:PadR family transcriptional regulator PadR
MEESLTATELAVLVAVARLANAAYGVTIREDVGACTGRPPSLASVYAALDRLEQRGLVRPWLSEPRPERGGRARRHFELTTPGTALVRRERANALRMWQNLVVDKPGSRR